MMILSSNYYYYDKVIPEKFCDDIVKTGKQLYESKLGVTGDISSKYPDIENNKKAINKLVKIRHSTIRWLQENWIYESLFPFIREANKSADWNFQWDYAEQAQFTEYGINQHYDWHCDAWGKPYKNHKYKSYEGKIRKLSLSLNLTHPEEYEGGDFQFRYRKGKKIKIDNLKLPKGSVTIFPSFMEHRVKPVTDGTRYSLVIWCLGNPYV